MSSSAFTPTTTQVTTEVPVNVPVVTAWQSYTPTYAAGAISGTTLSGFWRRQGDTLETKIRIQGSGSSSLSATTTSLNYLPSGLTVDTSKLPTRPNDRGLTSTGMCFGSFSNSVYNPCMLEIENPTTTARIQVLKTDNVSPFAATNFSALNTANFASTALNAVDRFMEFHLSVPISQWSSGVTTLADRALEEFVSFDGSIARGPAGSLVPSVAFGTGVTGFNLDFQQSLNATDSVILEFSRNGLGWQNAADVYPWSAGNNGVSGNFYGMRVYKLNATQYTVEFGNQGNRIAVSNQSAGALSWADERTAGTRFRLRKVSSGAQVGYPVSTKNIVGATDGVAPVTGMLGERISASPASTVSFGANAAATQVASLTLTPGTWLVSGMVRMSISGTGLAYFATISSSSNSIDSASFLSGASATVTGATYVATPVRYVTVSQNTPYYLIGAINYSSLPGGGYLTDSIIQAIRIA
jgi:hypothetical protein